MRTALPRRPARLARLLLPALLLLVAPRSAAATGVRLFTDGSGTYWDLSYGAYTGGSSVELVNGSKAPLEYTTRWRGTSSLRMRYNARNGGDWLLGVANTGWTAVDAATVDTLAFWAYSGVALPAADLPYVFIEDRNNTRSPRYPMAPYNPNGLPAATWTRLVMPLDPIKAGPGSANLSLMNKTFFAQTPAGTMGVVLTIYLDEIRWVPADPTPPLTPAGLAGMGFERHVDVTWDLPPADVESYRVERKVDGAWTPWLWDTAEDGGAALWLGAPALACTVRVVAEDWSLRESAPTDELALATATLDDTDFLDMIERATFRYFWQGAHPVSGLTRERSSSGDVVTSGGSGFGLMAVPVGIERGYVTRAEGVARVLQQLTFLSASAERHWGAFPHWLSGSTGAHVGFLGPGDDTVDLVETSYLAEGLLTVRRYFDGPSTDETEIRALATALWEAIEWDAFLAAGESTLRWHRSPTTGLSSAYVSGWNECMITYLLGVASPTHPIAASCYHAGWARNGGIVLNQSYYGYPLSVGYAYGGPMFFAHYSFVGFDARLMRDAYADYFTHNQNHARVQAAYCAVNPGGYTGYSASCWGLTASDDPYGYSAHEPVINDNGTLTPSAALGSMPYVPAKALAAARTFYGTYGATLWGFEGFKDAFNPGLGWTASDYIAIDQGPIVLMIENYRSQLLWNRFMSNPEIAPMLAALGFVTDSVVTAVPEPAAPAALRLAAAPNPSRGAVALTIELPRAADVTLEVFDLAGRRAALVHQGPLGAGRHALAWDGRGPGGAEAAPGVYLARLQAGATATSARLVRLR
jgi:hypothetical protein